MGKRYLIDSNVIIDYTSLRLPEKGSDFVENLFDTDFLISVATKIEVLGFNDVPHKLLAMEDFVNSATTLSLDDAVTNQTIRLRREYKKLKLGDAIIAATALVYDLVIISRNVSDFKNIIGLQVIDPHNL
jgi:predicted nucleic acid-binding protein